MVKHFELVWRIIIPIDGQQTKKNEGVIVSEDDFGNPFRTRRQAKNYALVELDLDDVSVRPKLQLKA